MPTFGVTKHRTQSNSLNSLKTFKRRTGIQYVGELIEAHTMLPVADPGDGPGKGGRPPLFLDQNEVRMTDPPYLKGLDPPLASYTAMLFIRSYCGT